MSSETVVRFTAPTKFLVFGVEVFSITQNKQLYLMLSDTHESDTPISNTTRLRALLGVKFWEQLFVKKNNSWDISEFFRRLEDMSENKVCEFALQKHTMMSQLLIKPHKPVFRGLFRVCLGGTMAGEIAPHHTLHKHF